MSNKCYLESYVPVSSLEGKPREYWYEYINKVVPLFNDVMKADESELHKAIENNLSSFKEKRYPISPYDFIDGEYYVHNGDITFAYCIPSQFMACFDKDDLFKTNINKKEYDEASEEDKMHYDYVYKSFWLTTTALKAKTLLRKHLEFIDKTEENENYIEFGNIVLDFLSSKDDKSIISLFSGEICLESSVEDLYSYAPQ